MVYENWQAAAREYSRMPESARNEYWAKLDSQQQQALREALSRRGDSAPGPSTRRRGKGGYILSGCTGLVAGVILTLSVQLFLIMMGIGALANLFDPGASSSFESSSGQYGNGSGSIDFSAMTYDERLGYCGTSYESTNESVSRACETARMNEAVDYKQHRDERMKSEGY